jgi:two-component system, NtrC family, sensor kinase
VQARNRQLSDRTSELSESLRQQTATADVLKAISRSAFDLNKVLAALIETSTRLCGADMGFLRRAQGGIYPLVATFGVKPEWEKLIASRHPDTPTRDSIIGRALLERRTVQSPDVVADPEYILAESQKVIGQRAILVTPMMRGGTIIGTLGFFKLMPGHFTQNQIELIETFADQAVIAIENTRLFEGVRARTKELTESLEYQTATSQVLEVISRSPTQLQHVFQTIAQSAARRSSATCFGSMGS